MAIELKEFIHVYDDVLSLPICQDIIKLYEEHQDKHERFDDNGTPNFTQLNFTSFEKTFKEQNLHDVIVNKVLEYRKKYYDFMDERVFPVENTFEQLRIKKYNSDGKDFFDTHVDVTNSQTCQRYLSFMFYLNDVEEGGETKFIGLTIKPKAGKLVVFPPLWLFPHKGNAPVSGAKYILSTYLHYI